MKKEPKKYMKDNWFVVRIYIHVLLLKLIILKENFSQEKIEFTEKDIGIR